VLPFNQRQGFLVSAVIHLALLMMLVNAAPALRRPTPLDPSTLERKELVFLPPPALLRQLAPALPRRPRTTPAPTPPPADEAKKDRMSVGPPSDLRAKGPMILRREDDLTAVPKGQPSPAPAPVSPAPTPGPTVARREPGGSSEADRKSGLRLPPGLGQEIRRGEEGGPQAKGRLESSIEGAVEDMARRLEREAALLGVPTGTGRNLYGFHFDAKGADFTLWVNHLKNEVYRNWIMPQPALLGASGHVDFAFTVERDGTVSALRILKSSGTASLDRAAQNALTSSRILPLPDDYGPPRLTIQVSFYYNEAPQGS